MNIFFAYVSASVHRSWKGQITHKHTPLPVHGYDFLNAFDVLQNEVILHRPIFISIRILIEMAFLRWKLRIGNDENGTLPWISLDSFDCWMEFTCHGAPQMATLDFMVKLWSRISFTICNILIIIIECSRSHACVYGQWVILKKVMLFTVLIRDRCKCVQWTRNACETANATPKIKIATL